MSTHPRRCVLNEKKKDLIVAIVKSGCGRVTAARFAGCAARTIANTAKRDPDFAKRLEQAESSNELIHIENINRAGRDVKFWRASAWMLERLHPERFAKASPDAVTPSQLTTLIVQIAEIIIQEVPTPKSQKGILKRLDQLLVETRFLREPVPGQPQQFSITQLIPTEPGRPDNDNS